MNIGNDIKINKKMTQFVVIGLGRFGRTVATTLTSLGNEVLAIDNNSQLVKKVEQYVSTDDNVYHKFYHHQILSLQLYAQVHHTVQLSYHWSDNPHQLHQRYLYYKTGHRSHF